MAAGVNSESKGGDDGGDAAAANTGTFASIAGLDAGDMLLLVEDTLAAVPRPINVQWARSLRPAVAASSSSSSSHPARGKRNGSHSGSKTSLHSTGRSHN